MSRDSSVRAVSRMTDSTQREALEHVRLDGGIGEVDRYGTGHAGSITAIRPGPPSMPVMAAADTQRAGPGGGAMVLRQRTNRWLAALFARLRTGSGMMPEEQRDRGPDRHRACR